MNQRKRLTQRGSRRRRAHRKTAKKGMRKQRGAGFFDFMKSINPFASSEPALEGAPVTMPTPTSIPRVNDMRPASPAPAPTPVQSSNLAHSMPPSMPSMRRRRNYRKNL